MNYTVIRLTKSEELPKAFKCGLIQLYQSVFSEPPYQEYFSDNGFSKAPSQNLPRYFRLCCYKYTFEYKRGEPCSTITLPESWISCRGR